MRACRRDTAVLAIWMSLPGTRPIWRPSGPSAMRRPWCRIVAAGGSTRTPGGAVGAEREAAAVVQGRGRGGVDADAGAGRRWRVLGHTGVRVSWSVIGG